MTPIEQQQMMQEYVRQMLAQRAQQNGDPQLQAGSRPPLAMGVGQPAPPPGLQIPGAELQGGYAPQMGRAGQPEPLNAQLMYRKNVPF